MAAAQDPTKASASFHEGAPSYVGDEVGEEDISAYPAAPTGKLPTPLADSLPTGLASSNPASGQGISENQSSNVNGLHNTPPHKAGKAPTGATNAPQAIAAV